jgi:hypothetical protein
VVERRRAVALARHYREVEGLSIAEIARRLGRAPATIKAYFYDPTGEKAKAVKAGYVGVCRGCGAYTQPRNGKGDAYAYCKACHPGAIERRWTREGVLAAMLKRAIGHKAHLCAQSPGIDRKMRTSLPAPILSGKERFAGDSSVGAPVRPLFGSVRSPVQIRAPRLICAGLQGFCPEESEGGSGSRIVGIGSGRRSPVDPFQREVSETNHRTSLTGHRCLGLADGS